MRPDWQDYEDGVLGSDEKRAADELLRSDPKAKKELEGLQNFRRAVREAALREPIPSKRLNQALAKATGPRQVRRVSLKAAVVAFALLAGLALAIYVNYDPNPYGMPETEERAFSSVAEAREWIRSQTKVEYAVPDIGDVGRIVGAHTAATSACVDFRIDGERLHVGLSRSKFSPKGCKTVPTADGNILVHEESSTVYVNCGHNAFVVHGGSTESAVRVGEAIRSHCTRQGI